MYNCVVRSIFLLAKLLIAVTCSVIFNIVSVIRALWILTLDINIYIY